MPLGLSPVVKSTFEARADASKLPEPAKVGRKNCVDIAVRPFTVTLTGPKVAPEGTATVREVADAALTVAFTAPKYTVLLTGVASKWVPAIVTDVPVLPEVGAIEAMVGRAISVMDNTPFVATFVVSHVNPDGHRTISESTVVALPNPNSTGSEGCDKYPDPPSTSRRCRVAPVRAYTAAPIASLLLTVPVSFT